MSIQTMESKTSVPLTLADMDAYESVRARLTWAFANRLFGAPPGHATGTTYDQIDAEIMAKRR